MDKKSQFHKISILFVGVFIIGVVFVFAGSFDPQDERIIGYEFLDDGKVIHIWNVKDDYFFNKSSGIQFTNYYQNYWTKNVFCLGYYSGGTWNKIKCADKLDNFNRDIKTDNETYINATLWKDFTYSGYDLRLGVRYHLKTNDTKLSVIIYGKNLGVDIPYDLGFAWKVQDIEIPDGEGDSIFINQTDYDLDGTYDLLFKNMSHTYFDDELNETIIRYDSYFRVYDYTKFLKLDWNKNLNYAIKLYSDGNQENAYVSLLINAGFFSSGQEKSTIIYWIDAEGDYTGEHFDTSNSTNDAPYGLASDGNYFWILDITDDVTYKYDMNGNYQTNWSLDANNIEAFGIATDGSNIWTADNTYTDVFKYDMSGTYITQWDTAADGSDTPTGVATDGNNIYTVDRVNGEVYNWSMTGSYNSKWSLNASNDNPHGITTGDTYFWILDLTDKLIYKYQLDGTCLSNWAPTAGAGDNLPRGIGSYGNYIYIVDYNEAEIYKYEGVTDTISPNVTINTPMNASYYANASVDFNVTALDNYLMDSCWVTIDDGVSNLTMTNTTHNDDYNVTNSSVPEGNYLAEFYCNDSLRDNINDSESSNFTIDTIYPIVTINSITPTAGTQGFSFNSTEQDSNLDSCKYSIFNSSGGIDGINENVSYTCGVGKSHTATTSVYGTFNLTIYANDLADNENSSTKSFTTSAAAPTGDGGGGGAEPLTYHTIGLIQPANITVIYNDLDKSIIFAGFNNYCEDKVSPTLAVINYYQQCGLNLNELEKVRTNLEGFGVSIPESDMLLWYKQYKNDRIYQTYSSKSDINTYGLLMAVVENPLIISPSAIDFWFIAKPKISYIVKANKPLESTCEISSLTPRMTCKVLTNTTAEISYNITDMDFFSEIFTGQAAITSLDKESRYINFIARVYNINYKTWWTLFLPAWIAMIIYLLVLTFGAYYLIKIKKIKRFRKWPKI